MNWFFGFELHPRSYVGLSLVLPRKMLVMADGARIGHFNVIWNLDAVRMGIEAKIGQFNWISATRGGEPEFLDAYPDRDPSLTLADSAAITQRHYIDCTDAVTLDEFALIAGVRSTLLGHHVSVQRGRQSTGPIRIGAHSLVSTNCVLLGGAVVPDHCIVGARSLVIKDLGSSYRLYAGNPATEIKVYEPSLPWFQRTQRRTF